MYISSLKQHIELFSKQIPKFDPFLPVTGIRNLVLHCQWPSGGSL